MATLTNTKVADSAEVECTTAPAVQTPKAARVATIQYDIESSPCLNDPREWSSKKKWFCLLIIATAAGKTWLRSHWRLLIYALANTSAVSALSASTLAMIGQSAYR